MSLKEKAESPLQTDDESQATDEENISDGEKAFVEKEYHSQRQEGDAEAG